MSGKLPLVLSLLLRKKEESVYIIVVRRQMCHVSCVEDCMYTEEIGGEKTERKREGERGGRRTQERGDRSS